LVLWLSVLSLPAITQTAHAAARAPSTHTVKSGEALSLIAERHGVSLPLLRQVNSVGDGDKIRPGQVLVLPRVHLVAPGEVLGTIAERYGLPLKTLYESNDLNEKSVIRVGQRLVLPGGYDAKTAETPSAESAPKAPPPPSAESASSKAPLTPLAESASKAPLTPSVDPVAPLVAPKTEYYQHKVLPSEVLSVIAQRYSLTTRELREVNQLRGKSLIRVGQTLRIPVTPQNLHITRPPPPPPPKSWHAYALKNFKRGHLTLRSLARKWSGQVFDKDGNLLPTARRGIYSMLGAGPEVPLAPELLQMMVQVSDEFGGRPLRVVSGYRKHSYSAHSKHPLGRALDFSVPGVPNSVVVDYLLTLPNAGVGYYPNSTHVHLDTRPYRMHWVDVSGPGQAPRYVHKSAAGERAPLALSPDAQRRPRLPNSASVRIASLALHQQTGR
jgi:LysM repeat protein